LQLPHVTENLTLYFGRREGLRGLAILCLHGIRAKHGTLIRASHGNTLRGADQVSRQAKPAEVPHGQKRVTSHLPVSYVRRILCHPSAACCPCPRIVLSNFLLEMSLQRLHYNSALAIVFLAVPMTTTMSGLASRDHGGEILSPLV